MIDAITADQPFAEQLADLLRRAGYIAEARREHEASVFIEVPPASIPILIWSWDAAGADHFVGVDLDAGAYPLQIIIRRDDAPLRIIPLLEYTSDLTISGEITQSDIGRLEAMIARIRPTPSTWKVQILSTEHSWDQYSPEIFTALNAVVSHHGPSVRIEVDRLSCDDVEKGGVIADASKIAILPRGVLDLVAAPDLAVDLGRVRGAATLKECVSARLLWSLNLIDVITASNGKRVRAVECLTRVVPDEKLTSVHELSHLSQALMRLLIPEPGTVPVGFYSGTNIYGCFEYENNPRWWWAAMEFFRRSEIRRLTRAHQNGYFRWPPRCIEPESSRMEQHSVLTRKTSLLEFQIGRVIQRLRSGSPDTLSRELENIMQPDDELWEYHHRDSLFRGWLCQILRSGREEIPVTDLFNVMLTMQTLLDAVSSNSTLPDPTGIAVVRDSEVIFRERTNDLLPISDHDSFRLPRPL